MTKTIRNSILALCSASIMTACAKLPVIGDWSTADADSAKTAASDAEPYVDYWQTRDPSEYRRSKSLKANRKQVGASQDVVLTGKTKPAEKVEKTAKPEKASGARVSLIVPIQQGQPIIATPPALPPASVIPEDAKAPSNTTEATPANRKPTAKNKLRGNTVAAARKRKNRNRPVMATRKDLWGRVSVRSVLATVEHPRIEEQVAFLKRNPGYLNLLSQRSRPYLHYIVEQIDRYGLPPELALLPMVESAFQPTAVSSKAAAGLWQIIPATGQEQGLMIAEGYDGRFDIHTSTEAALRYLRFLNKLFKGDWLLTLAAYNAGPGAVRTAIEANSRAEAKAAAEAKQQAAEEAKRRAAEEAKQQAAIAEMKLAAAAPLNTATDAVPTLAPTLLVAVIPPAVGKQPIPAKIPGAVDATKTPTTESTPSSSSPSSSSVSESVFWRLKLPKETQDYVPRVLALARIVANPKQHGLQLPVTDDQPYLYRIDVASDIKILDALALAGIPTEDFFRFNPGFKPGVEPPARVYNLLLPWEQAQNLVAKVPGARLMSPNRYTVKKGETLMSIAKQHGVSLQALAQWNKLSVKSVLKAGQKLIVYPTS